MYFSKKQSIYAQTVAEILAKRLECKTAMKKASGLERDQLDAKQNAFKIFVNTIYGLSGAETFQLYDSRVAAACTSIARHLTQFARESVEELNIGKIVFRDTDSCAVIIDQDRLGQIHADSANLNKIVN